MSSPANADTSSPETPNIWIATGRRRKCSIRLWTELFQASLGDAKLSEALLNLRQLVAELKGAGTVSITIRDREGYAAARDHFLNTRDPPVDSIRREMRGLIATQDRIIRDAAAAMRTDLRFGLLAGMTAGVAALVSGAVALGLWQHQQVRAERERQLVYEKKQAEASDQQKSTFLATVSHEIRTPMSAILGFSEMLRAEATNERQHRFASSIVTAGRTLLQLINDVLDISKIEAGRLEIRLQPADLRQVAEFVRTLFSEQAAAKGLKFDTQVADPVPATILMDVTRLRQILVNVVGNAIKFTESGHVTVRIDARPTDDDREYSKPVPQPRRVTIEIHVEDSGIGILPEERERIFRPFVQGARTTEARQPGTGLGLSIVRRLTELMGGAIHLDSEPGRGTKFHLIFPDIEVSARLARREGEEPDVTFADFEPFDVLVVDDNPSNQAVVSEFLGNAAREVRFASDGRDAVDAVSRYRPDIVLMDLQMPGMDGHEALDRIRRLPGCELLPVLAVTASSLSVTESGKRWKFDGYVRKPFSRARLYREIAQFLPKKPVASRGFPLSRSQPEAPGPGPMAAATARSRTVSSPSCVTSRIMTGRCCVPRCR